MVVCGFSIILSNMLFHFEHSFLLLQGGWVVLLVVEALDEQTYFAYLKGGLVVLVLDTVVDRIVCMALVLLLFIR